MKIKVGLIMAMSFAFTAPVVAMPLSGTIGSSSNFTVIHDGSNPGGAGDRQDWRWFDANQQINVILDSGILTLNGAQTFNLNIPSDPEAAASVTLTEMWLDLNDSDGFAGGYLDYSLDGNNGTFSFADHQYGSSPFNSTIWSGNEFTVYLWGGDIQNELGIDLALTAIPEPGVIALFLLGLSGVIVLRRRPLATRI